MNDKLKQAAHDSVIENGSDMSGQYYFMQGAKSDAAKQYWQEQQEVDVEELRKEFIAFYEKHDSIPVIANPVLESIFNFFLPHLKQSDLPTDEESEEWFTLNIAEGCSASSAIYKFRLWLKERRKNERI